MRAFRGRRNDWTEIDCRGAQLDQPRSCERSYDAAGASTLLASVATIRGEVNWEFEGSFERKGKKSWWGVRDPTEAAL